MFYNAEFPLIIIKDNAFNRLKHNFMIIDLGENMDMLFRVSEVVNVITNTADIISS